LPTAAQRAQFSGLLTEHAPLREGLIRFIQGFPRDSHPMALLSSYRKLRCLDHLRTQDKGTQPFTLVAGAGTLEVPSFDLEACKPYVDFTFTSRLVTHQNRAYGVTLKAAETLKTALAEAGIMLEPPPAIRLPANLEPGEEALAQGRGE
jgi:hypothetical protein